jgi:hypothetical protein
MKYPGELAKGGHNEVPERPPAYRKAPICRLIRRSLARFSQSLKNTIIPSSIYRKSNLFSLNSRVNIDASKLKTTLQQAAGNALASAGSHRNMFFGSN